MTNYRHVIIVDLKSSSSRDWVFGNRFDYCGSFWIFRKVEFMSDWDFILNWVSRPRCLYVVGVWVVTAVVQLPSSDLEI